MKYPIKGLMTALALSVGQLLATGAEPRVLDTIPPSDAGRGLVRVDSKEIRHYGGHAKQGETLPYIVSKDNGETWTEQMAGDLFPKKWGGIMKEAAATVYLPKCKKFIMVQPIRGHIFMADDLDGEWVSPSKDGKKFVKSDVWMNDQSSLYSIPGLIFRNPLELSNGRIIIPMHGSGSGTKFLISDDKGLTWKSSEKYIFIPAYQEEGIDQAPRWRNAGVEGTVVELKNGKLYALVRTDSNHTYESFSKDKGDTWSEPEKSPFYGSLVMSTLGRLKNGKLICFTTNSSPMPELPHKGGTGGEDVFTARGALHVAMSDDEGKTWYGYREVIIDALRDSPTFATDPGDHDRSCHQAEFEELDSKRILVTSGQQELHRKMIIIDQDWVAETSRTEDIAKNGLKNIHGYVYIPFARAIQYNRKPGLELVDAFGGTQNAAKFGILNDPALINEKLEADYRRSGLTWNFPNTHVGEVSFNINFPKGSQGCYVSLTDRMLNPCDPSAPVRAVFSGKLAPGVKLGNATLKADTDYKVTLRFKGNRCAIYINKGQKPVGSLDFKNQTKVGLNYLHFIAAEDKDVTKGTTPVEGCHFFQFEKDGEVEEKSTIVSDFKMQGKKTSK